MAAWFASSAFCSLGLLGLRRFSRSQWLYGRTQSNCIIDIKVRSGLGMNASQTNVILWVIRWCCMWRKARYLPTRCKSPGAIGSFLGLLFCGKDIEPVWGRKEFLIFIILVNSICGILAFCFAIALYYVTGKGSFL